MAYMLGFVIGVFLFIELNSLLAMIAFKGRRLLKKLSVPSLKYY